MLTSTQGLGSSINAFHVASANVPAVWSSIKHNDIVWCNSLMSKLAGLLNSIVQQGQAVLEAPSSASHQDSESQASNSSAKVAASPRVVGQRLNPGAVMHVTAHSQFTRMIRTTVVQHLYSHALHALYSHPIQQYEPQDDIIGAGGRRLSRNPIAGGEVHAVSDIVSASKSVAMSIGNPLRCDSAALGGPAAARKVSKAPALPQLAASLIVRYAPVDSNLF